MSSTIYDPDVQVGDLAVVDPRLDPSGLYIELRSPSNRNLYAMPRVVLQPESIVLVLERRDNDVLVLTVRGERGWIMCDALYSIARAPLTA